MRVAPQQLRVARHRGMAESIENNAGSLARGVCMRLIVRLVRLACVCLVLGACVAGAQEYERIDIPPLPGDFWAQAVNLNGHGQVVGSSIFFDYGSGQPPRSRTFIWSPATGTSVDLTLGGLPESAVPADINDYGQVVGGYRDATGYLKAFLWTPHVPNGTTGTLIDLGTLWVDGTAGESTALALNNRGQVVGEASAAFGLKHAFLWSPTTPNGTQGTKVDLGTLDPTVCEGDLAGGESVAKAINERGDVVGWSCAAMGHIHAFLWQPTTPNGVSGAMTDLGAPAGFIWSVAEGINGRGQIAVSATSSLFAEDNTLRSFLWTPAQPNGATGAFSDLGDLPREFDTFDFSTGAMVPGEFNAAAINGRGQLVGWTLDVLGNIHKAAVWTPTSPNGLQGHFTDLGAQTLNSAALGINEAGRIAGTSLIYNGGQAHLWQSRCDVTPVAHAGTDQTAVCTGASGAQVVLDGSRSCGPAGSTLAYTWDIPGVGQVTGERPTIVLPVGIHVASLIVDDGVETSSPAFVRIVVTFDVEGFAPPLAALVLKGEEPPLPAQDFLAGSTLPLRVEFGCGGAGAALLAPPEIVELRRDGQPVPLSDIDARPGSHDGVAFEKRGSGYAYNLGTTNLLPGTYEIVIQAIAATDASSHSFSGAFVLRPNGRVRVSNDDFDRATKIHRLPFADIADTALATEAPDDPECAGRGPTVWYVFTPREDMRIVADTLGSQYLTTLSAYTGQRGALSWLACEASGVDFGQAITIDVVAGETYYFMVGSLFGMPGGQLHFQVARKEIPPPPANDDFEAATVITALPFSDSLDTSSATTAPDDPNCRGQGPTVWYTFTAPATQRIDANTFGGAVEGSYDTVLTVYRGRRGALEEIACNDDAGSVLSQVIFEATAGETYYFMIGSFGSGAGGPLVFDVSVAP
jgi:probable HAF family extracellular repeat protein